MKKLLLTVLFLSVLFLPFEAFACACCAERGEYFLRTAAPSSYEMELLSKMKFDRAVNLFMSEAGFEMIKGLKTIEKDYEANDWTTAPDFFDLTNNFAAKSWKFNFKTKTGKTGTLVLPMPAQMLSFKVDTHDTPTDREVVLYKEWRFKGNVQSGNGFFSLSILRPTTYFLVLQGHGNGCDNTEDFTHWRLEINGKNANYSFIGDLNNSEE